MSSTYAIGFDIGGTKCAVILGRIVGGAVQVVSKRRFATSEAASPEDCLERMCREARELTAEAGIGMEAVSGAGISCGGPLNSTAGVIQSPPNLPGWDNIPAVAVVSGRLGIPAGLENDANACAIAEWRFGAGRGSRDMIFLTFGTGLGAGIISGGRLISGHSGMAGECGHIRLAPDGPTGYGKAGSFEGFCSGGGLAQVGRARAVAAIRAGRPFAWCPSEAEAAGITAKVIGDAAEDGDQDAIRIYRDCGRKLGEGLSILIDILNPEVIVIGSIFARSENLLREAMAEAIAREALPVSAAVCRVVPAGLGEAIGDIASLAVAMETGK